jgi:hypothetical protein
LEVQERELFASAEAEVSVDELQFPLAEVHSPLLQEDVDVLKKDAPR